MYPCFNISQNLEGLDGPVIPILLWEPMSTNHYAGSAGGDGELDRENTGDEMIGGGDGERGDGELNCEDTGDEMIGGGNGRMELEECNFEGERVARGWVGDNIATLASLLKIIPGMLQLVGGGIGTRPIITSPTLDALFSTYLLNELLAECGVTGVAYPVFIARRCSSLTCLR
ncbi:hypothetical protein L210DRAFT_3500248 [Boletus edulis BED1]|uniref:Uncharacterized protein n=1 Tax=Boletus edulis BED1 TaxID=1328754 RepID=A0AAD4C7F6_BOLED|nr:hypothetical protein L210DRAFT_3500248 [Boletus edulis BED1]